jgi:hypothetical protein
VAVAVAGAAGPPRAAAVHRRLKAATDQAAVDVGAVAGPKAPGGR